MELADETYEQICALSQRGNDLADEGSLEEALLCFEDAWDLLPEPKIDWDAARWLLAAIGDLQFQLGELHAARENLSLAMLTPKAIENPFLHLRLGQVQFELGQMIEAADELGRAYELDGTRVFNGEDPKYLELVKAKLS